VGAAVQDGEWRAVRILEVQQVIKVNEKYLIDVDDYNYTVYENKPQQVVDKQTGKEHTRYPAIGYFGGLQKALLFIRDRMVRDELKGADTDLCGALEVVTNITNDFKQVMDRILAEKEER
jgi:hypothetical protein